MRACLNQLVAAAATALLVLLAAPGTARARPWRALVTPNFRVLHLHHAAKAAVVAALVERVRGQQLRLWGGDGPHPAWRPRCEVYIYPSNRVLVRMTGGSSKAGSAQTRHSRLMPGKTLRRRINVAATDRHLLSSTLPHEITHVVASDLVGGDVPRWANEGMAVLAEPLGKIRYYDVVLRRALGAGRWFPLRKLMTMTRYPDRRHVPTYYGQSTSLVLYLVTLKSNMTFVEFLKVARSRGYVRALRRFYGLTGYKQLQQQWYRATRVDK